MLELGERSKRHYIGWGGLGGEGGATGPGVSREKRKARNVTNSFGRLS